MVLNWIQSLFCCIIIKLHEIIESFRLEKATEIILSDHMNTKSSLSSLGSAQSQSYMHRNAKDTLGFLHNRSSFDVVWFIYNS